MKIQRAYKVELDPNNRQRTLLEKSAGTARFAYNWALNERIKKYEEDKTILSAIDQHKILCSKKKAEYPWMYEVSKCAPQEALRDLDVAFKNFFRGLKTGQKVGFPKFKSKHKSKASFSISDLKNNMYLTNSTISIPKIGTIRLKEKNYIPTKDVKYNSMTVSKTAGKWFVSVSCEQDIQQSPVPEVVLGIDLGIKTLAVCSNGETFENNKYLKKSQKKLARAQRSLSRKRFDVKTKKSSNNRNKAKKKVANIHYKIACQRNDAIHKMTSTLVKTKPRYLVLEDLNVKGMMKNHKLAAAVADASFYEIRRQLTYKAGWYGGEIIDIDRWFPSSKRCRICGFIHRDLTLSDRTFVCPECGHTEDRDGQASMNLEKEGLSTLSSRGIKACGESVRPQGRGPEEAVSRKQEESKSLIKLNLAKIL